VALTLLPLVCLALLYWLLLPVAGSGADATVQPRRLALLYASLGCGVFMVVSTEVLSLFHALTRSWTAALWGGAAIVLAAAVRTRRGRPSVSDLLPSGRGVDPVIWVCLSGCAVVLAVTAFIALAAAPNTWDSMTYHLARVMHWQQDRSVAFYATGIQRQIHLTPGAEYIALHLHLLSGGDRLDNIPQWLAGTGSLLVVSLIAARLGATARGQALAAVVCATLPMGILQSTSTQNDYVVAYWLACLVALIVGVAPRAWVWAPALGAAVGLAILTKATAYVFATPFLVWLAARLVRDDGGHVAAEERPRGNQASHGPPTRWSARLARLVGIAALAGVVAVGLNSGQFARNHALYGTPFGPDGEGDQQEIEYLNGLFSSRELASNVMRNATLQVSAPVSSVNRLTERAVVAAHRALGIDPNDSRTTYGQTRFSVRQTSNGEDTAGNPLQFALLVAVGVVVATNRRYRRSPVAPYLLCLLAGFLLFSLLLRWQPWNSRLVLPLFVLASAAAGVVLGDMPRRLPSVAFAVGLALAAIPWLVANRSRPLVASVALQTSSSILSTSRTDQYFAKRPELQAPYRSAATLITTRHARRVGIVCHEEGWEYPLWVLLGAGRHGTPVIEHTGVRNLSARLGEPAADTFDAIVCIDCQPAEQHQLEREGFQPAQIGPLTVLFAGEVHPPQLRRTFMRIQSASTPSRQVNFLPSSRLRAL
jgi:hypothetical protein